jgi:hypothetical protein
VAPAQDAREPVPVAPEYADAARSLQAGVSWLVRDQQENGSWRGSGKGAADVGTTGLALLALADARAAPTARARGLQWLMRRQDPETGLIGERIGHDFHYGHAIAAQALCGAVDDPHLAAIIEPEPLREAAGRAIDYVLGARNPYGVWRYDMPPTGDNDTSVTGWMIGALRAAEAIGLSVDRAAYGDCLRWLDGVTDYDTGRVGYDSRGSRSSRIQRVNDHYPPESGEAMTAIGLSLRSQIGQSPDRTPVLVRHAELMQRRLPAWDPDGLESDLYYWYHGTEAMASVGGEGWAVWRAALTDAVIEAQRTRGAEGGSWDPIGPWSYAGGRAYSTALMTSCLAACLE